jgi:hypothetical protein
MRALVAARRAALLLGRSLLVCWDQNHYHLCCDFSRLFANRIIQVGSDYWYAQREKLLCFGVQKQPVVLPSTQAPVLLVEEENFFWVAQDKRVVWGQYGPHRVALEPWREELLEAFAWLQPAPAILRAVEAYRQASFGPRVLGVHIRHGDNLWSNTHTSDPLFAEVIAAELERLDAQLFVCTDDPQTNQRLQWWFGKRVLTYPVRSLERGRDPEAIEDALICMLLLARTQKIIRSSGSSFSQVASWLGNVPTVDVGPHEHSY